MLPLHELFNGDRYLSVKSLLIGPYFPSAFFPTFHTESYTLPNTIFLLHALEKACYSRNGGNESSRSTQCDTHGLHGTHQYVISHLPSSFRKWMGFLQRRATDWLCKLKECYFSNSCYHPALHLYVCMWLFFPWQLRGLPSKAFLKLCPGLKAPRRLHTTYYLLLLTGNAKDRLWDLLHAKQILYFPVYRMAFPHLQNANCIIS